ncbi:MAG: hypothetical protein ACR2NB_01970 [Solirubrobacteraceae bacterium]
MERPDWVPAPAWARLATALRGQPGHASDALADLEAATASMDETTRRRLVDYFAGRAEAGAPLPAAFILALIDLLEAVRE